VHPVQTLLERATTESLQEPGHRATSDGRPLPTFGKNEFVGEPLEQLTSPLMYCESWEGEAQALHPSSADAYDIRTLGAISQPLDLIGVIDDAAEHLRTGDPSVLDREDTSSTRIDNLCLGGPARYRRVLGEDALSAPGGVTDPVGIGDLLAPVNAVALVHGDDCPAKSAEPLRDDACTEPPVEEDRRHRSAGSGGRECFDVARRDQVVGGDVVCGFPGS